ncbi:MAG: hypothetical protein VX409_00765, partial [Verrucomicrobiota bacterium]|nr:hypothetical protein [Verrucomicrobiota bacterium]
AVKLYKRAILVLQREKTELEKKLASAQAIIAVSDKRLAESYTALGETSAKRRGRPSGKTAGKVKSKVTKKAVKKTAAKRRGRPSGKTARKAKSKVTKKAAKRSLKDVVLSVTKGKSLDAKQIFDAACKAGHKFGGKNPINSLRVLLYTNKNLFKNKKGKFTAA